MSKQLRFVMTQSCVLDITCCMLLVWTSANCLPHMAEQVTSFTVLSRTLCMECSRTCNNSTFMISRFGVTRQDLVVAMPSDPSRAALIQASKAWRQARIQLLAHTLTPSILCLLARSLNCAVSHLPHLLSLSRKYHHNWNNPVSRPSVHFEPCL